MPWICLSWIYDSDDSFIFIYDTCFFHSLDNFTEDTVFLIHFEIQSHLVLRVTFNRLRTAVGGLVECRRHEPQAVCYVQCNPMLSVFAEISRYVPFGPGINSRGYES